jgi:hypothetical protein
MIPAMMKVTTVFRFGTAAKFRVVATLICLQLLRGSLASDPPQGIIQGTINDVSGQAGSIKITAFLLRTPNGSPAFAMECQTTVDSEGRYTCPRVSPGRYILLAEPIRDRGLVASQSDMPSSTFYPGTNDIEEAELANVRSGASNVFNFSLQQRPLFQISGRIEGKPGSAALEIYRVDSARGFELPAGQTVKFDPATGIFAVGGIAEGHYLLTGVWQLASEPHRRLEPEVSAMGAVAITVGNNNVSDMELKPESLATLDGQLELDGERPGRSFHLRLLDVEDRQKKYDTTVGQDGEFRFANLPCGRYQIDNLSIAGAYVKAIKIGDLTITSGQFVVPSNPQARVKINASLHSKTISGSVSGWNPGDSYAYVLAKNNLSGDVQITKTNRIGQFSIGGLAPGEYDLYAWTSLEGIAYETRYGLGQYESEKVTVSTDDTLSAEGATVPLSVRTMQ